MVRTVYVTRIPAPWAKCPNSWARIPANCRLLIPATSGRPIVSVRSPRRNMLRAPPRNPAEAFGSQSMLIFRGAGAPTTAHTFCTNECSFNSSYSASSTSRPLRARGAKMGLSIRITSSTPATAGARYSASAPSTSRPRACPMNPPLLVMCHHTPHPTRPMIAR